MPIPLIGRGMPNQPASVAEMMARLNQYPGESFVRNLQQQPLVSPPYPANLPPEMLAQAPMRDVTVGGALRSVASGLPIAGEMLDVQALIKGIQERDPAQAGLGALGLALPFVPFPLHTVFHGSPHRFSKFDLSKIGTGEGAQAYGHGLYFAEAPGTARWYKSQLEDPRGGEVFYGNKTSDQLWRELTDDARIYEPDSPIGYEDRQSMLEEFQLATDIYKNKIKPKRLGGEGWTAEQVAKDLDEKIANFSQEAEKTGRVDLAAFAQGLRKVRDAGPIHWEDRTGALYKVEIPDEAVANMLDWDKPLREQPESVRKALGPYIDEMKLEARQTDPDWGDFADPNKVEDINSGQDLYKMLEQRLGGKPAATEALRKLGIPGIRYLDRASRGQGQGSRNLVLFDENLAEILEIDEKPVK